MRFCNLKMAGTSIYTMVIGTLIGPSVAYTNHGASQEIRVYMQGVRGWQITSLLRSIVVLDASKGAPVDCTNHGILREICI